MPDRPEESRSVIIIGAGVAGLSAGIYAQLNGYQSQIYEMHTLPGGLMTSWKRKGYTIDGCIHWLTGSSPTSSYYAAWKEIGLLHGQEVFDPEIFMRYQSQSGQVINFYTDIDRYEKSLLEFSPADSTLIHQLCSNARALVGLEQPIDAYDTPKRNLLAALPKLLKMVSILWKWSRLSMTDYGKKYQSPLLKEYFADSFMPEIPVAAYIFVMAYLQEHNAGYPIGGSLPMALGMEKRYQELGGTMHYQSRVEKIMVENNRAVGIRLADGSEHRAGTVISSADGHATIFDMLEGRYVDQKIRKVYADYPVFPPLVLVGLGVDRKFDNLPLSPGGISLPLEKPIEIAGKQTKRLDLMVYNFDPTLAPEGKTVLTATIPTEYTYWKELAEDQERYSAEKERIGLEIIQGLDQHFPGFAGQVEMADVATPMTFERYTGNWQASFEGFLPTPKTILSSIPKTLPGLDHFYMAGQWVQVGGGLPSGLISGRDVIGRMCKRDGIRFKKG